MWRPIMVGKKRGGRGRGGRGRGGRGAALKSDVEQSSRSQQGAVGRWCCCCRHCIHRSSPRTRHHIYVLIAITVPHCIRSSSSSCSRGVSGCIRRRGPLRCGNRLNDLFPCRGVATLFDTCLQQLQPAGPACYRGIVG